VAIKYLGIQLDQLEDSAAKFIAFAESLGRPLVSVERNAGRPLLVEFEAPAIRGAFGRMKKERLAHYTNLIEDLREFVSPYPVKQAPHLERHKSETVAELHKGNFALLAPAFNGVHVRRLSAAEATERVALMVSLCDGIAVLAYELALVRNSDRPEAARMRKLANLMAKRGRLFAARCEIGALKIKQFQKGLRPQAMQYALDGHQALYLGGDHGELYDQNHARLVATVKQQLGVNAIVVNFEGSSGQHITLTGAALSAAMKPLPTIPLDQSDEEMNVADQTMSELIAPSPLPAARTRRRKK